jgi:hypothetical protein
VIIVTRIYLGWIELSQEDFNAVLQMDIAGDVMDANLAAIYDMAAPGDEGFNISHEGGKFEVYNDLAEDLANLTG